MKTKTTRKRKEVVKKHKQTIHNTLNNIDKLDNYKIKTEDKSEDNLKFNYKNNHKIIKSIWFICIIIFMMILIVGILLPNPYNITFGKESKSENSFIGKITGFFLLPTGKAVSSVYVILTYYNVTCTIPLEQGWNLVSSPCILYANSIQNFTSSIQNNLISIHYYQTTSNLDYWKVYGTNLDDFVITDLNSYSEKRGYWISVTEPVNITIIGDITLPNFIELYSGWNLISWTSNETKNITVALAGISGKYSSIHAYYANDTNDPWKAYNPNINPALNDLITLHCFGSS